MQAPLPSNRSFGWTFTGVFAVLGAWSVYREGSLFPLWFVLSAIAAALTVFSPDSLTPLNRWWMKLAEILNRVVSPVVLGVMFFCVFTPVGAVMRRLGRDPMKRKFDPASRSYWIDRTPPGPAPESLREQF
jgi:hypothetical protein